MKPLLAVVAFVSLAGFVLFSPRIPPARATSNPGMRPVTTTSCVERYKSLLRQAKSALAAGDRGTTVESAPTSEGTGPGLPRAKGRARPGRHVDLNIRPIIAPLGNFTSVAGIGVGQST